MVLARALGDPHRVFQDDSLDIIACIDIDPAHELHELARFSLVVAAGFIDGLADEVKGHS